MLQRQPHDQIEIMSFKAAAVVLPLMVALPSHAEGGTDESACPDFVVLDITLEIESIGGDSLAETVPATARLFADGSGRIVATIPQDSIQGTLGAGGTSPAGLSLDRLAVQLTLSDRKVGALLISGESDDKNRSSELVAVWP